MDTAAYFRAACRNTLRRDLPVARAAAAACAVGAATPLAARAAASRSTRSFVWRVECKEHKGLRAGAGTPVATLRRLAIASPSGRASGDPSSPTAGVTATPVSGVLTAELPGVSLQVTGGKDQASRVVEPGMAGAVAAALAEPKLGPCVVAALPAAADRLTCRATSDAIHAEARHLCNLYALAVGDALAPLAANGAAEPGNDISLIAGAPVGAPASTDEAPTAASPPFPPALVALLPSSAVVRRSKRKTGGIGDDERHDEEEDDDEEDEAEEAGAQLTLPVCEVGAIALARLSGLRPWAVDGSARRLALLAREVRLVLRATGPAIMAQALYRALSKHASVQRTARPSSSPAAAPSTTADPHAAPAADSSAPHKPGSAVPHEAAAAMDAFMTSVLEPLPPVPAMSRAARDVDPDCIAGSGHRFTAAGAADEEEVDTWLEDARAAFSTTIDITPLLTARFTALKAAAAAGSPLASPVIPSFVLEQSHLAGFVPCSLRLPASEGGAAAQPASGSDAEPEPNEVPSWFVSPRRADDSFAAMAREESSAAVWAPLLAATAPRVRVDPTPIRPRAPAVPPARRRGLLSPAAVDRLVAAGQRLADDGEAMGAEGLCRPCFLRLSVVVTDRAHRAEHVLGTPLPQPGTPGSDDPEAAGLPGDLGGGVSERLVSVGDDIAAIATEAAVEQARVSAGASSTPAPISAESLAEEATGPFFPPQRHRFSAHLRVTFLSSRSAPLPRYVLSSMVGAGGGVAALCSVPEAMQADAALGPRVATHAHSVVLSLARLTAAATLRAGLQLAAPPGLDSVTFASQLSRSLGAARAVEADVPAWVLGELDGAARLEAVLRRGVTGLASWLRCHSAIRQAACALATRGRSDASSRQAARQAREHARAWIRVSTSHSFPRLLLCEAAPSVFTAWHTTSRARDILQDRVDMLSGCLRRPAPSSAPECGLDAGGPDATLARLSAALPACLMPKRWVVITIGATDQPSGVLSRDWEGFSASAGAPASSESSTFTGAAQGPVSAATGVVPAATARYDGHEAPIQATAARAASWARGDCLQVQR
ncbi:hypothetical protein FNF31_02542 [Cafeteria roenbergensis]|uniref:Uncharacterized protein n=1 Tax=Cafeteria roenbergensis TaxID=33653 RepID=A0A5A8DEQ9_CAFRO|nr:hypothetical protein FNF31_02542 [Cafeteria roenbergensis]